MSLAFVFPGQGSQYVGMGKDLFEKFSVAREFFERANDVLKIDLIKLCFEGPEEKLKETEITQPAIFTVSAILSEILIKEKGIRPKLLAGHSLGEYSALFAASSINFESGVKMVNLRGKFMQEAVPVGEGGMAAILGLTREDVEDVCKRASLKGTVEPANINSPEQIVISGKLEAVREASKIAKEVGAKKVIELKVSAPFHSSLMERAARELEKVFKTISFDDAKIPVVSNVSAKPISKGEEIKKLLVKQMTSPVLWVDSVRTMIDEGVSTFIEVGPGKVLSGLIKKIDNNAKTFNVEDVESLDKLEI